MAFLMENVCGLAYGNQNRPVFRSFLDGVSGQGRSRVYAAIPVGEIVR